MEILKVEHLSNAFDGKEILKDVNFTVNSGEIIGYIGPNGAGKSTTIKIIMGLNRDYFGEVSVFGKNIKDSLDYKKKIGYVPEASEVYENLTAVENIELNAALYEIDIESAVQRAKTMLGVLEMKDVMDSQISSFSKGMRQKYLFVLSLIHDPDIVFLDEPLSGIDANSVLVIKEILASLKNKGKTIFYSSHILEVVEKLSDKIILLQNGKVILNDSIDNIKKTLNNNEGSDESLENIFNEVTGFTNHKELAEEFVKAMGESDV